MSDATLPGVPNYDRTPDTSRLIACIAVIDVHAETLRKRVRSDHWPRLARDWQAKAMLAVNTEDWDEARDALDHACSVICGSYGLNPLPLDTESWRCSVEGAMSTQE